MPATGWQEVVQQPGGDVVVLMGVPIPQARFMDVGAFSGVECSAPFQGWQTGLVAPGATMPTLLFGGALVGSKGLSAVLATSYTEASVSAPTWTEGSL